MDATENVKPIHWTLQFAPFFAALTFPFPCLHFVPYMFSNRNLDSAILMSWLALAIWSIYGICICMRRGTKYQQLVALLALPTFVPIAAGSFTFLYMTGYLR